MPQSPVNKLRNIQPTLLNIDHLNAGLTRFEKGFNRVGYFPILSTVSGYVRAVFGAVELVTAVALAALQMLRLLDFEGVLETGVYALHGVANIVRGMIEMMPIINMFWFLYDNARLRLNYNGEEGLLNL